MLSYQHYFCLADAEREWANPASSWFQAFSSPMNWNLQWLPLLFAPPDATIWVTEKPQDPNWNCPPHLRLGMLEDLSLEKPQGAVWTWAYSALQSVLFGSPDHSTRMSTLASKKTLLDWDSGPPNSAWVRSWSDIQAWQGRVRPERAVLKASLGSSGRGHYLLPLGAGLDALAQHKSKLERLLAERGGLIIQPWWPRILDFSSQWWVSSSPKLLGTTLMLNSPSGKYCGSIAGPSQWIPEHLGHFWSEHEQTVSLLLTRLFDAGYEGPCGVDAMIVKERGSSRCIPIVEINPRHTMGWVAVALQHQAGDWVEFSWNRSDGPGIFPRNYRRDLGPIAQYQPSVRKSITAPRAASDLLSRTTLL
jgi:hypothetical protein